MYNDSASVNILPIFGMLWTCNASSANGFQLRKCIGGAPSTLRITFPDRFSVNVNALFVAKLLPWFVIWSSSLCDQVFRFIGAIGGLLAINCLCLKTSNIRPMHLKNLTICLVKHFWHLVGRETRYLITWTTNMKNHRPVFPHNLAAVISMNTSQYSNVVNSNFRFVSLLSCSCTYWHFVMMRSLNNTSRFDSE